MVVKLGDKTITFRNQYQLDLFLGLPEHEGCMVCIQTYYEIKMYLEKIGCKFLWDSNEEMTPQEWVEVAKTILLG